MVLLDGDMEEAQMIEHIIRGVSEAELVKHKLLRKFHKDKIQSLTQLEEYTTDLLREHIGSGGTSLAGMVETVNYTSQSYNIQPYGQRKRWSENQQGYDIPNLKWPKPEEIPKHLKAYRKYISILLRMAPTECFGCGKEGHRVGQCNPTDLLQQPICNGNDPPPPPLQDETYWPCMPIYRDQPLA